MNDISHKSVTGRARIKIWSSGSKSFCPQDGNIEVIFSLALACLSHTHSFMLKMRKLFHMATVYICICSSLVFQNK